MAAALQVIPVGLVAAAALLAAGRLWRAHPRVALRVSAAAALLLVAQLGGVAWLARALGLYAMSSAAGHVLSLLHAAALCAALALLFDAVAEPPEARP